MPYASFAFSDIGEDRDELRTFAGVDVLEVLNYPPAPCPPGLTITCMRHAGELKVVLASVEKPSARRRWTCSSGN
ncbi:MAG: hypothetical protein IPG69_14560 [Flavobacteriales bacterium]|nr:hypothetical protein [Flavobacteriales bacterium]